MSFTDTFVSSRRTRATAVAIGAIIAFSQHAFAEEKPTSSRVDSGKRGTTLGFDILRMQDDFGLGARIASPNIGNTLRIALGGGAAWYPHAIDTSSGTERWQAFYHLRLGVETGPPVLVDTQVRPYAFGAPVLLFMPNALSDKSVSVGGVGGIGIEAFFRYRPEGSGPVSYFLEAGGIGTSAKANQLPGSPVLANGFFLCAGFRVYP